MGLNRTQKKYLKKYLKKKGLDKIAVNLKVSQEEIEKYLEKRWGKVKYQKFMENNQKTPKDKFKDKVRRFSFQTFFKENWLILCLLSFLVFVSYVNSLGNEFVSDDIAGVLNNENLNSFSYVFSSFFRIIRFFQPSLHTIINLTFGKSPAAFRFLNILFHLATTITTYVVVYLLLNRMTAIFAVSIMAVHPIVVESVTWISGGGHCMYSFFIMLSILFYILTIKNERYLYFSIAASFLAITISEKAFIFPLILLALAVAYKIKIKNWKKLIIIAIPILIIGIAFLSKIPERMEWLQTSHYHSGRQIQNPILQIPIAISSYLELLFWPKNLTLYHSEMFFSKGEYFFRLAIFIAFLGIIIYTFKRNRHLFFWLSLFIISLLPTLTPFGISWIVAERYVYLGAIGIFVVVAMGINRLNEIEKYKTTSIVLATLLIIALMTRTIVRNTDWKNQDRLWIAAAKTSPSSPQNHNNLGDLYARRGDLEKAAKEFQIAIQLNPNYGDAYHNLANTYQQMGKPNEAIENYQKALSFNSNLWQSHQNLAAVFFNLGEFDLAKQELEKAINVNPQSSNLYAILGIIHLKSGEKEKAKEAFLKALEIDPQSQRAREGLSSL